MQKSEFSEKIQRFIDNETIDVYEADLK